MNTEFLAFDRASVRTKDKDGRMHLSRTPISKATVNEYLGSTIPNWQQLGLEPDRHYRMLRHPDELRRGAETFRRVPLLSTHIHASAEQPRKEHVIGAIGSDTSYEHPYLWADMSIWDAGAIDGVETGRCKEISSSYHYRADMTPGVWEGQAYDGVMRDIVGNHAILTPKGRAGSDVCAYDSLEDETMQKAYDALKPYLAADADEGKVKEVLSNLDKSNESEHKKIMSGEKKLEEGQKEIKKEVKEVAKDELAKADEEVQPDESPKAPANDTVAKADETVQPACDSLAKDSVASIVAQAKASALAEVRRLKEAEADVRPLVGDLVAMDSADDVYRFALKASGVAVDGVHPSAYPTIIGMLKKAQGQQHTAPLAMDEAAGQSFAKMFPNAVKLKRG